MIRPGVRWMSSPPKVRLSQRWQPAWWAMQSLTTGTTTGTTADMATPGDRFTADMGMTGAGIAIRLGQRARAKGFSSSCAPGGTLGSCVRTILMWFLVGLGPMAAEQLPRGAANAETGLVSFPGCRLINAEWADGDSFPVRFPDGTIHTVRLYGVDCLETTDRHEADQRRLRSQRAYFGIARAGGNESASIQAAKALGIAARDRVGELLRQPFSVHTAWADARGHPDYKRYYAFITGGKGKDLGSVLVREGLARAFGVARSRKAGVSRDEYKERLKDEELAAASRRVGIWKLTNWDSLPEERRVERTQEQAEQLEALPLKENSINPNTASRDELMRLSGIGEVMAVRIMEAREAGTFRTAADLKRVAGIGEKTVARIAPYLSFPGQPSQ